MSKSSKKYHSNREQERKIFEDYFNRESLHDIIKRVVSEGFDKRNLEKCVVIEEERT